MFKIATLLYFFINCVSMIGIPFFAGFVSKWYILKAGFEINNILIISVMVVSTMMNCIYLLPIVYNGFTGKNKELFQKPCQAAKAGTKTVSFIKDLRTMKFVIAGVAIVNIFFFLFALPHICFPCDGVLIDLFKV